MAEMTITTGTTITTVGTTTTITTTTTIETEAPAETPATETAITEAPTEVETTGTLPAPAETPATETAITEAPVTALQKMQTEHEKAVEYCIQLEAEEFAELIRWAQHFGNRFPFYAVQLKDVVNADDVYKDSIVRICEPLGEEVVRRAIKLVDTKKILDLAEYLKHIKIIVEEWGEV